ncbi:MAG: indole-3-glycerol phosphate synthase TrpC [Elusimicrobia bacterium]|nr:indole-3-glycerol phosphate synthase TrpC [Elusimicrobiota bacterium]
MMAADALADIVALRRRRLSEAKEKTSMSAMERMAKSAPESEDFTAAVVRPGRIALIAEMKRRSPSAGSIREAYNPAAIAAAYEEGGAAALSVLTEPDKFGGELSDIRRAKTACRLPVLRKDFIFDPYQIAEARANGADAVLLIAEMLSASEMAELASYAREMQVEPLVEVFSESVLDAALASGAKLIGINSRNLRTLEMRPDNFSRLAPRIPADRYVIAESGIKTADDVEKLKSLRVSAMLVGESILKQTDLSAAVRVLANAGGGVKA